MSSDHMIRKPLPNEWMIHTERPTEGVKSKLLIFATNNYYNNTLNFVGNIEDNHQSKWKIISLIWIKLKQDLCKLNFLIQNLRVSALITH